jgi:dTDP-4-dehydrorhamnose reductase
MTDYRIGVTGYSGMVGQELMKYLNVFPLACDVRKMDEVDLAVRNTKVDVIVHLASISDVNKCEDPKNQILVDHTNIRGTMHVAQVAEKYGCDVVLLSTCQVFDGKWGNYKENHKPNPVNYYGFSKMGAESLRSVYDNLKIIRTSYLFDHERMFRHIYPLRVKTSYEYPTFMKRSFMYVNHFVDSLYHYLLRIQEMPKVLHIAGSDTVSWYEFMKNTCRTFGLDENLICPRGKESGGYTPRPHNAGLNTSLSRNLGLPQYSYRDGLAELKAGQ